ncbi:hypothetical protein ONS96_011440 [Cadophora gregata f. sp. sojae]|nr:hypothetical protein ONS96_011440 [Cadophora gregata f. sp. sojae]
MEKVVPSDDGAVSWKGVVITLGSKIEFLCFDPAPRTETTETFSEVVGPGPNSITGA